MFHIILSASLHVTLNISLLWYELGSATLVNSDFKLNPYYLCPANKNVNGQQYAIIWHVDDSKISYADENAVHEIVSMIERKFGNIKVVHVAEQECLGM